MTSTAKATAPASKEKAGGRYKVKIDCAHLKGAIASNAVQVVIDFPALGVENVGEFGGSWS